MYYKNLELKLFIDVSKVIGINIITNSFYNAETKREENVYGLFIYLEGSVTPIGVESKDKEMLLSAFGDISNEFMDMKVKGE